MNQRAFTIVELLLVITIISVLLILILPAIQQSREAGNIAVCQGQERQLGVAFSAYTNDWNDTYPYANPAESPMALGTFNNWSARYCNPWMANLGPYLGYQLNVPGVPTPNPAVLRCPDNPWPPYNQTAQNTPAPTYGMGGAFPSNYADQSGVDPYTDATHFIPAMRGYKLKRPSLVCLLGEIPNMTSAYNTWNGNYADVTIYYLPFYGYNVPAYYYIWANSDPINSDIGRWTRVNHLNHSWNSLMSDGSAKISLKSTLVKYATDAANLHPNTDGLMFWNNRTQ